jgi:hypothetical protein
LIDFAPAGSEEEDFKKFSVYFQSLMLLSPLGSLAEKR